jgi:hypothetical protein
MKPLSWLHELKWGSERPLFFLALLNVEGVKLIFDQGIHRQIEQKLNRLATATLR